MATNDPHGGGSGAGPGPDSADEGGSAGMPDPGRGGCFGFGWGCLPVIAAIVTVPGLLLF